MTPREGVWDIRDVKSFHTPKKIDGWMAIVFDNPRNFSVVDAQNSIGGLASALKAAGSFSSLSSSRCD